MEEPRRCKCGSADIPPGRLRKRYYICRECSKPINKAQYGMKAAWQRGCDEATVYRCRAGRCVICNVAPWVLARYHLGSMQVGHLVPGDANGGFEPMCKKCNRFLGVRALTQKTGREVLFKARRYWSRLQLRNEAWVHTDVDERGYGIGGVSETPGRQRRLDAFNEQREGARRRSDSGSDGLPAVGSNDSVVLPDAPDERHPED